VKRSTLLLLACAPMTVLAPTVAFAQQFDRSQVPALDQPPVLKLPALERGSLPNGVTLQLVQQHELPLVQVTLVITGGTKLDAKQPGLASFTTRMLTEGAGTRDANALQGELAFLGAQLFASAGTDASSACVVSISRARVSTMSPSGTRSMYF